MTSKPINMQRNHDQALAPSQMIDNRNLQGTIGRVTMDIKLWNAGTTPLTSVLSITRTLFDDESPKIKLKALDNEC